MSGSFVLQNQISVVVLYASIFSFLITEKLDWPLLLCGSLLSSMLMYGVWALTNFQQFASVGWTRVLRDHAQTTIVLMSFGFGLSPVFRTLTETISTDTIYAMATCMFVAGLVFHDYGIDAPLVCPSFSLNSSIFGAVCLISRLPTAYDAFALLSLAIQLFALWPIVRQNVDSFHSIHSVTLTALVSLVLLLAFNFSMIGVCLYWTLIVFICFICPLIFMRMQHCKRHYYKKQASVQHNSRPMG